MLAGSREERLATLTELIRAALAAAITAGVESLNIEYDSTYPELTELAESFPSTVVERRHVWMRH